MAEPVEKRALLVEDDWQVAEVLKAAMVAEGWTVDVGPTRARALALITRCNPPYTLALLDLILPDGNGLTLASDIKECNPLTEIAIVTGYGKVPEAVLAVRYGVRDFLDKPVRLDELRALLDRAYTRASVNRGPEEERASRITDMFSHMSDRLAQMESEIRVLKRHGPGTT